MPWRVGARVLMRAALGGALLTITVTATEPTPLSAPTASAATLGPASSYQPLGPTRLADTRSDEGASGFSRLGPDHIRVQIAGRAGVAADASAAVLNIASVEAAAPGFVTVFPAGGFQPATSSLNVANAHGVIANLVTVKLGAGGAVDIFTNVPMHLVVDLAGAYVPVPSPVSTGRLTMVAGGARRIFDTRVRGVPTSAGFTELVALDPALVPADAIAAVVNLAVVDAEPGFWTAFAGGTRPLASNLNVDSPVQTRSAQAVVPLTVGLGGFSVFSQSGGHLVVDLVGWFSGLGAAASTDGLFVPTDPERLLDTRLTYGLPPWGDSTIEFDSQADPLGLGGISAAVSMNIAATDPLSVGFVTAFPAGVARPATANLNVTQLGDVVSNHAIVPVGSRGLSLYTQNGAHLIADVAGYYLGTPVPSVLPKPVNPPRGPTLAVSVSSSSAGLSVSISNANIFSAIARGAAGLWGGSGLLGLPGHNIYFAHRSSAGGPFRNLDNFGIGSSFTLRGADGSRFHYVVVRTAIISPSPTALSAMARSAGSVTATLVACHPPGSTAARIVVVGVLVGAS